MSENSPQAPLLSVSHAVKDYSGHRALNDMDFDLRAGEVHALLGENGAGKSTLVKAISGAIELTKGEIRLNGELVDISHPQQARALGISVVHQHGNLVPELSILENVLMAEGLSLRAGVFVNWKESAAQVREILDNIGLEHLDVKRLVSTLKPHEAAMVAIAKAQASNAKIIILDEPTSTLQAEEVEVLFKRMRRLASQGIGLIFITHRLAEVFQVTDRATVMMDGSLIGTWDTEALDHETLVNALVGPDRLLAQDTVFTGNPEDVGEVVLDIDHMSTDVLKRVSFQARTGEVVGVASLPGEGSDEIIEALFGITKFQGKISIDGKVAKIHSPRSAIAAGMALVPRDRLQRGIVGELSVRENASLAAGDQFVTDPISRFMRRGRERNVVEAITSKLSLKARNIDQQISTLSGGNQQKVVIAKWLIRGARVYLLDSPSNAVDVHTKTEIYQLARDLAKSGAAVIFTSTEVEEFVRICDRVLVLYAGKIVGELAQDWMSVASIMRLSFGSTNV